MFLQTVNLLNRWQDTTSSSNHRVMMYLQNHRCLLFLALVPKKQNLITPMGDMQKYSSQ